MRPERQTNISKTSGEEPHGDVPVPPATKLSWEISVSYTAHNDDPTTTYLVKLELVVVHPETTIAEVGDFSCRALDIDILACRMVSRATSHGDKNSPSTITSR